MAVYPEEIVFFLHFPFTFVFLFLFAGAIPHAQVRSLPLIHSFGALVALLLYTLNFCCRCLCYPLLPISKFVEYFLALVASFFLTPPPTIHTPLLHPLLPAERSVAGRSSPVLNIFHNQNSSPSYHFSDYNAFFSSGINWALR